MMESIPDEILETDRTLHALCSAIPFSRYLNPLRADEARLAFLRGGGEPALEYAPATWAEDALEQLSRLRAPQEHPLGALFRESVEQMTLLVRALHERSEEAFDALARASGWYPSRSDLFELLRGPPPAELTPTGELMSAGSILESLESDLRELELSSWRVILDPVMVARVLVDGPKRLIRIKPSARFSAQDRVKLRVHELEVHALRSEAGRRQPLQIFSWGTPSALRTEEGLALLAEERAGLSSPREDWQQNLMLLAVSWAREHGFREVYQRVLGFCPPSMAWNITLRVKRGLLQPGQPGTYAKDTVYCLGQRRLRSWLSEGGDLRLLYVGHVGIEDPLEAWIGSGWLRPDPLPPVFRGSQST